MSDDMGGPSQEGSPIYLDHNATTPVLPEVFEAMRPWLTSEWGNPSSAHVYGRRAKAAVHRAREQVAELVGATAPEIIFTSCGSEADNLAVLGACEAVGSAGVLLSSKMEHPAIEAALERQLRRHPQWELRKLSTDSGGRVDLASADFSGVDVASVMLAHNETGAIQPVAQLSEALRAASPGVVVHTDAAQAVGKIGADVDQLGVDLMTIVGHKFGAPKGVGALYCRSGTPLRAQQVGGGHECGMRAGTEAVAQVVALGEACRLARARGAAGEALIREKRERFWQRLRTAIPGVHRTVVDEPLLPNTLHICLPGLNGREFLGRLPELAASTGSACHAASDHVPGILGEMGLGAERARGALRLSLGFATSDEDIERAAELMANAYRSSEVK